MEQWLEGIICGYAKGKESDPFFSRLIIGIKDEKKLNYIRAVGSGFSQRTYKQILSKIKKHQNSPFSNVPDPNKGTRFRRASTDTIYWVKPELICYIRYQEITNDGLMRIKTASGREYLTWRHNSILTF